MNTYSPTQVILWDRCERKYAINYIEGTKEPKRAFQEKGSSIDADITSYLKTGVLPTTPDGLPSPYIQAAIIEGYTPPPHELPHAGYRAQYAIQREIVLPDGVVVGFKGFADRIDLRGSPVEIIDDKSTSDFKYAKTEEQLREDTQLLSYGATFPDQEVRLSHVYYLTRGKPRVRKVSVVVAADHVKKGFERITCSIVKMEAVRQAKPVADDVAPTGTDTGLCSAYGGCAFRKRCGLDSGRWSPVQVKPNALLEKLKGMKLGQTQPVAPVAPVAPVVQDPPVVQDAQPVKFPDPPPPISQEAIDEARGVAGVPILPPDAAPRDAIPAPAAPAPIAQKRRGRPPKAKPEVEGNVTLSGPEAEKAFDIPPGASYQTSAETARAAGFSQPSEEIAELREKLAEAEALAKHEGDKTIRLHNELDRADQQITALKGDLIEAREKFPVVPAAEVEGLTIYVDCFPTKGEKRSVVSFEDWAAMGLMEAANVGEVPDAGLINYTSKGVVAVALRQLELPKAIFVSSRSRWWDVASEILIPKAKLIVKGV